MSKRIALGLSGGVDSAVSAYLLKQQGYDVHCFHLICFDTHAPGCRGDQDRKDALAVAMHLGLPFQVLDFQQEYQQAVIDYFKSEYEAGRTPNPDVVCNREIKFGLFYDWALRRAPLAQGKLFDYIATGHYAKLLEKSGSSSLARPKDLHKDQTYFLWQVPREKFEHVLFPLGDLLKSQVRDIAKKIKLPVARKKDSTGICFIGEVRVEDFLKKLGVKEKKGDVVDTSGRVIGHHRGVAFYTIGQRHGFDATAWPSRHSERAEGSRPPLYVIEKDVKQNRLVVGFGAECYRSKFTVSHMNWLASEKDGPSRTGRTVLHTVDCFVRIRHGGDLIPAILTIQPSNHLAIVRLHPAQRGIASGQSAVFYEKETACPERSRRVLGGGIIQDTT